MKSRLIHDDLLARKMGDLVDNFISRPVHDDLLGELRGLLAKAWGQPPP